MRAWIGIALVVLAVPMSACGDESTPAKESVSSVEQPTSAVVPSGLEAPPQHTSGMYPKVTFDPCTQIGDETITKAGFDPKTAERNDSMGDPHTKLACLYSGADRNVVIGAANSPFDEEQARTAPNSQPTTINGRQSLIGVSIVNRRGCTVEMRTSFGEIIIDMANKTTAKMRDLPQCEGALEIAQLVEQTLPKGI